MKYQTLSNILNVCGMFGTMYLFSTGHVQGGYWCSGLVMGLSMESVYNFICGVDK